MTIGPARITRLPRLPATSPSPATMQPFRAALIPPRKLTCAHRIRYYSTVWAGFVALVASAFPVVSLFAQAPAAPQHSGTIL